MLIKRIDHNTTLVFYKPLTSKPYIKDIIVYNDHTFSIVDNWHTKNLLKDQNIFRKLLYKTNLLDQIINNKILDQYIEV